MSVLFTFQGLCYHGILLKNVFISSQSWFFLLHILNEFILVHCPDLGIFFPQVSETSKFQFEAMEAIRERDDSFVDLLVFIDELIETVWSLNYQLRLDFHRDIQLLLLWDCLQDRSEV